MDSYLVRIYRKKEDNPRLLVGTVEEPGGNGKKAFSNIHELWEILIPIKRAPTQLKRTKNSKRTPDMKQS
ncbi:MAG: hypothetical protein FJ110_02705 [Deltaproteobacteria bacterium]|nr:hypothetical protein [Deltaproteobacteria bacterium]